LHESSVTGGLTRSFLINRMSLCLRRACVEIGSGKIHGWISRREATMIDSPVNAEGHCADGPCGRSTYVVINPAIHKGDKGKISLKVNGSRF